VGHQYVCEDCWFEQIKKMSLCYVNMRVNRSVRVDICVVVGMCVCLRLLVWVCECVGAWVNGCV